MTRPWARMLAQVSLSLIFLAVGLIAYSYSGSDATLQCFNQGCTSYMVSYSRLDTNALLEWTLFLSGVYIALTAIIWFSAPEYEEEEPSS